MRLHFFGMFPRRRVTLDPSAGRAQLPDQVRQPQGAHRVMPEGADRRAEPLEDLRTERPLDLLEVTGPRCLLAHAPPPDGVPEIVEVREPFAAGHRGPLPRVEPDARAGRTAVEVERLRPLEPGAHQEPL